ncbi:MAG: hypothetical protein ACFFE4_06095 [Candidatus Thorarchaeota archaeon]
MGTLNLVNNIKNEELFRRYVAGARLNRGKNIPNRNIINFSVEKDPRVKIIADIQGSGSSRYVINIIEDQIRFKIIHDCPDFKKGTKFCKHIVKILLLIDYETCRKVCQNVRTIIFSSNFNLVKESKTESYLIKAEELISNSKYFEALSFLESAYRESNNFEYIQKAIEVALNQNLIDQILRLAVEFENLIEFKREKYPEVIRSALSTLSQYNFSKQVEIILNAQKLLGNYSEKFIVDTLNQPFTQNITDPVLKYLLLFNFESIISIEDFFRELGVDSSSKLKSLIEQDTLNLTEEAILNMESEGEVDSFARIANICKFSNYNLIFLKVQKFKEKLKNMYIDALKLKHAFLRSLVIANTGSDKLKEMKFIEKYNYPTLIWTSPFRSEDPIHYYILEKCGIERHHLEYLNKRDFIENYPLFKSLFNGNNPIRHGIKEFWGTEEPQILNTVQNERVVELEFEVNLKDLDKFVLIEWDLAQKPILGSYVYQFKDGFLIPDNNHPLAHEIQPFDLILCDNNPIAIKGNNVKIYRPIRRINVKAAIELIWGGIDYISSYLPLVIIENLKTLKIDEFDAYNKINDAFNTSFLPNKTNSLKKFQNFIQKKALTELNKTYLKVLNTPNYERKVLKMIGFEHYSEIFKTRTALQTFKTENLKRESLQELKLDLKKFVSDKLTEILKKKEYDQIDIKVLRSFPTFRKWTLKIIYELKKQLEKTEVYRVNNDSIDITNLLNNYYGRIITKDVIEKGSPDQNMISIDKYSKILENFRFLKLKIPKIKNAVSYS